MNIAVLLKQVPAVSDIQLAADNNLVRVGAPSMLNPVDLHALEAALALKDQEGGTVTLVTMGTALASDILREGIAMGADKGILLSDERMAGSDTLATGRILAAALGKLGPFDLVLTGKRSTDGDTGQIPPALAQRLGMTLLSYADELEVKEGKATIRRLNRGGAKWPPKRPYSPYGVWKTLNWSRKRPAKPDPPRPSPNCSHRSPILWAP